MYSVPADGAVCGRVSSRFLPPENRKGSAEMARKNRVSVYDGIYHVTSRIANRAMLLAEDGIKDRIMEWVVSVAAFSGVEVWAFCIMDNHLHLFVHVPPVPERYWLDPDDEPAAYAFGMRPPECREPLWSPDGDCPPPQRPGLGFMLDDAEMLGRLSHLYGRERAAAIGREWAVLRGRGLRHLVDEAKERYCRRMYNLSQFVKTLKERVSMWYNAEYGHEGCLWQGRFYSGVVEKDAVVKAVVAAYIGYNPVKARIASTPASWKWSSYALAVNDAGPDGERCRRMYETMLGRPWEEVRATLESMYADRLPDSVSADDLKEWLDDYDENAKEDCRGAKEYRASQAIQVTMRIFSDAYIGHGADFLKRVAGFLPERFPRAGSRSVRRCRAFVWELPRPDLLKTAA